MMQSQARIDRRASKKVVLRLRLPSRKSFRAVIDEIRKMMATIAAIIMVSGFFISGRLRK